MKTTCRLQGLCRTNRLMGVLPLSRSDLSYGLGDRYAKRGVAVEHGDTDLDFRFAVHRLIPSSNGPLIAIFSSL